MAVTTSTDIVEKVRSTPEERRATAIGIVLVAIAAFVLWVFALGVDSSYVSTFNLSLPGDPDLTWAVSSQVLSFVVAAIIAFIGGWVLRRTHVKWTNLGLAIALTLFALAFLTWAAADKSFSLVGMLRSTVILSVPVTLGALTGLMCERVAIINIAIEGQLLTAAFVGTVAGSAWGIWAGLIGAMLTGAILGLVLAVLSIRYRIDQIIAGVVINIFALGLTSFLARRVLSVTPELNSPGRFSSHKIPLLGDIPVLGSMFFNHNMFVYGTYALVLILHFGFFYTRWGLRSRAVGEHPKAADTVGIDVYWTRYRNVVLGGLIAGFGGAFLTLAQVSRFEENLTAGIGYIGLAAMIFGRWMPFGALGAGLVFGFALTLQQKLGILGTPIPSEFLSMTPYLVTIIVVAGVVGRSRPPAADGQPYIKD
ncbi:MAG: ABC transporter permease [Acidimicrobiia bacterium]|nr:ABC transporter permease [Acidimicrobiia bacterium]MDH5503619.1 ABC transporter permease [Acidimicrobiia bacterium]